MTTPAQAPDYGTCGCGKPADKFSSGQRECWGCWNYRKLDGPAARHWAKVAREFLSNVDFYDYSKYLPACGLTPAEIETMIVAAAKVRDHSALLLMEHGG
jgi:hypothetical protein